MFVYISRNDDSYMQASADISVDSIIFEDFTMYKQKSENTQV